MNHSEFENEAAGMNRFTAEEVSPLSETVYEQVQLTTSPPPAEQGFDPYLLAIRIMSILLLLCLLFVAALYYGVINP